jgi:hypothetical protein
MERRSTKKIKKQRLAKAFSKNCHKNFKSNKGKKYKTKAIS